MRGEEHAFRVFQKMLQSDRFPSVMLLYGPEDYLIRWAGEELENALIHPAAAALDRIVFSERRIDTAELIAACETLPVMSKRRLVIVDDCEAFGTPRGRGTEPGDFAQLADYMRSVPESTLLLFRAETADKRTKAYRSVREAGIALEFSAVDRPILRGFVQKQLKTAGKHASRQAIDSLIDRTGYGQKGSEYTLTHLMNDLAKAIAYSAGAEITTDDFDAVTAAESQSDAFALLEAAFSGDKARALALWKQHRSGLLPSEADREVFRMIALICSQLEMTLVARERIEEGQNPGDLATVMGVHPFRLRKALETAKGQSTQSLAKNLAGAYELEIQIKSGRMPADVALELFIACV